MSHVHRSPHARIGLLVAALATAALAGSAPVLGQSPSASAVSADAPASADPAAASFADVRALLGGPAHHGTQPGPGPAGTPVVRWSFREDDGIKTSPILVDGVLIVGGLDHTLRGIDPATGRERWRATLPDEVGRGGDSAGGMTFWPDAAGGVQAVDAATGNVLWRAEVGATPNTNPTVVDGVVYVGTETGAVGLDATTGEVAWSVPTSSGVRTVTVADGRAIFGSEDRIIHAAAVADGAPLWTVPARSGSIGPAVVDGDQLYIAALQPQLGDPSSELLALDAPTGDVRWSMRSTSGLSVSPLGYRDGTVYVSTQDEGLLALAADDGTRRWQVDLGQALHGFAVTDDRLYAATMDGLLSAVDLADGTVAWQLPIATDTRTNPVVSGGLVFVAQEDGTVAAYGDPVADAITPSPSAHAEAGVPVAAELVATLGPAEVPGLDRPFTIDVAPDGSLVVANGGTDEILVLDADGALIRRWGGTGTENGQFKFRRDEDNMIGGVAVGADGTVYVADTQNFRVQAFSPDGTFLRRWGAFGLGEGQFTDPTGAAVAPDGTVLIVDDDRDVIQRFTPEGAYLQTIGSEGAGDGQMDYTGFIEVAPDGSVLNADFGSERVQAWNADGEFQWKLGSGGTGPGQFRGVVDVDTDASGNLWVADKHRVQVFAADDHRLIASWTEPGGTLDDELSNLVVTDDGTVWVTKGWGRQIMKLRSLVP